MTHSEHDDVTPEELSQLKREIRRSQLRSFFIERGSMVIGIAVLVTAAVPVFGTESPIPTTVISVLIGFLAAISSSYLVPAASDEELKSLIRERRNSDKQRTAE